MKKPAIALLIVGVFVAVVGVAGGVVAIGYYAVKGVATEPPSDEQKRLVLNAQSFTPFDIRLDPRCNRLLARRNLDRTREIEFEHDCEGSEVYVSSVAEISPTVRDARESFLISVGAYKAGVAIGSGELHPRDDLLTVGEQHYAGIIRNEGDPIGNVFIAREGRVLHTLLITGIYFDEPAAVRDLFHPLLEESRRQFPSR